MKTLKRAIAFLLCSAMVFAAFSAGISCERAEARTIVQIEDELKEYKNLLASLQKELSVISGEINTVEGAAQNNMELLKQYQAQIEALEAEIAVNTAIKESYDLKRAQVIADIVIAQEDYDYRVSMYKKLMQFVYENGETNYFAMLFSSSNISEFLTKRDNFNDIMNAANQLLKDVRASISDLEQLDSELKEAQSEYEAYEKELECSKRDMELKITEFNNICESLGLQSDDLREQFSEQNEKIKEVKQKIAALEEERKKAYEELQNSPSGGDMLWPLASYKFVTSNYGWRTDPINGSRAFHNGIDIAADRGTPIYAAAGGVVIRADEYSGYGNCVIIYHGNGVSTLYAHCDNGNSSRPTFEVKAGDTVKAGQVIAYVGSTGRSTGYHLHFGVMEGASSSNGMGNYVDPNKYIGTDYRVR